MNWRGILNPKKRKELKKDLKVQEKQNLEVRDSLAMQRTKMANERTLLSYMRTATAMILAGLTFIKLFDDLFYIGVGLVSIPVGIMIAYFGYRRYSKQKLDIERNATLYSPTSPILAEVVAQEKADPDNDTPKTIV
jgi:putative membrane protein